MIGFINERIGKDLLRTQKIEAKQQEQQHRLHQMLRGPIADPQAPITTPGAGARVRVTHLRRRPSRVRVTGSG